MSLVKEFKEFAMKGNVVDMAVGIIIGAAFGKIVSSIVTDIIMPPIGLLVGGVDFSNLKVIMKEASVSDTGAAIQAVTLNYGKFIQTTVDFVIVAFAIFLMIKAMNRLKKREEIIETTAEVAEPTKEEILLTEIRDLLKNNK